MGEPLPAPAPAKWMASLNLMTPRAFMTSCLFNPYRARFKFPNLLVFALHMAKTEHSHPLGMVVSTHFRCGKGVKRGLKNGALPFNID